MDPNRCLEMIHDFITNRETGECVDYWCQDLFDWLERGGFEPNWKRFAMGTSYYECRAVHHLRGERLDDD